MASYVVYGWRSAVAVHRSFACTREELPAELQRVAGRDFGPMIGWECVESREAADKIAMAHCVDQMKKHPLTKQELAWINEGASAAMRA